jgi:hypothetical protein
VALGERAPPSAPHPESSPHGTLSTERRRQPAEAGPHQATAPPRATGSASSDARPHAPVRAAGGATLSQPLSSAAVRPAWAWGEG